MKKDLLKVTVATLIATAIIGVSVPVVDAHQSDASTSMEAENHSTDMIRHEVKCVKGKFPEDIKFEYSFCEYSEEKNDYVQTPLTFIAHGCTPGQVLNVYDDCKVPLMKDRLLTSYTIDENLRFKVDYDTVDFEYLNLPEYNVTIKNPAYQLKQYRHDLNTTLTNIDMTNGRFNIDNRALGQVKVYIVNDKDQVVGLGQEYSGSFDVINKHKYSYAVIDYYSGSNIKNELTNFYAEKVIELNWN